MVWTHIYTEHFEWEKENLFIWHGTEQRIIPNNPIDIRNNDDDDGSLARPSPSLDSFLCSAIHRFIFPQVSGPPDGWVAIALVEASPAEVTRIRSKLEDVVVVVVVAPLGPTRLIPNVDKLCTPNNHRHGLIIASVCVATKQATRDQKVGTCIV